MAPSALSEADLFDSISEIAERTHLLGAEFIACEQITVVATDS